MSDDELGDRYSTSAADSAEVVAAFYELGGRESGLRGQVDLVSESAILALRPPGRRRSLAEAAVASGLSESLLAQLWNGLGFGADGAPLSDEEIDAITELGATEEILGNAGAVELSRVIGLASRQIAEAVVSAVRLGFEVTATRSGEMSRADLARSYHALTSATMPTLDNLNSIAVRRHLAVSSKRDWAPDADAAVAIQHVVVGFADLVGFTAWSAAASDAELADALDTFESSVWAVAADTGVELVKLIGDEVMFTCGTTEQAVVAGQALVATAPGLANGGIRVGIARGRVLARSGDLFGPTVNLAARLVGAARPGTVVVGGEAIHDVDTAGRQSSAEVVELAGFDGPTAVRVIEV